MSGGAGIGLLDTGGKTSCWKWKCNDKTFAERGWNGVVSVSRSPHRVFIVLPWSPRNRQITRLEELEQLRLELTILKEDHRVEKELLQREIDELTTDDRPDLDVDEEEAVFVDVEADDESPSAPFPVGHEASNAEEHIIPEPETETEERSFEAVNEDQNDEAATQEDMDAIFGAITEDGPSDEEEADVLGSSEAEDTKRESGIAPVPTDIESLFKAPRVEEPSVTPESNAMAESDSSSPDSEDVERCAGSENAPFAIHWNADRPGHHQDLM